MKRLRYLVSSLLAAGFVGQQDALATAFAKATTTGGGDPDDGALLTRFAQDHLVTLASHSSHSSHASHSSGYGGGGHFSHTSHRSSSGGYGSGYVPNPSYRPSYEPSPVPTPTAPTPEPAPVASPLFSPRDRAPAPPPDGLPALSGRTRRFASIVRRVQIALMAQGFYSGAIDGVVGPVLRGSLRAFQKVRALEVTGTITPATLDALMVSSQ